MKTIFIVCLLAVSCCVHAQKRTFIRVYNAFGQKITKGIIIGVTDSALEVKKNGRHEIVSYKRISFIRTKRSIGRNVLAGSVIGGGVLAGVAIIGNLNDEGFASGTSSPEEAGALGFAVGAPISGGIGFLVSFFKKSDTYFIDGDITKWGVFKNIISTKANL